MYTKIDTLSDYKKLGTTASFAEALKKLEGCKGDSDKLSPGTGHQPPEHPKGTIAVCTEIDECKGHTEVLACLSAGDGRSIKGERDLLKYQLEIGEGWSESQYPVTFVSGKQKIQYGRWGNQGCRTAGRGWHVSYGTCGVSGAFEDSQRCRAVLVRY